MPLQVFEDEERDDWNDARPYNIGFYWAQSHFRKKHEEDDLTQKILRLKQSDPKAVQEFTDQLSDFLCGGIAVAVVPGHDPAKADSGIRRVACKVAAEHKRIDLTTAIVRTHRIQPLHRGGDRSEEVMKASLAVRHAELIRGKTIVVLDDVTTSGTSLTVCRGLLMASGAERVKLLALGKTK